MHLLQLLPFLTLASALPHAKQEKSKKSISIAFTQRNVNPRAASAFDRLSKRQSSNTSSSGDDVAQLLNDNNVRYIATLQIAGQELDLILDTGSTDTFVLSAQPDDLEGAPVSELPQLFDNSTATGVTYTGLQYNASYGSGDGITETLGAIGLATVAVNGTDLTAQNLTFANLYQSSSSTGASGLIGLGFPLNGDIFLTVCEAANATGQPLSIQQASAYYPLVPTLQQQGQIQRSIFSLVVDRLPIDVQAPSDAVVFNYTRANGTFTIGDYPEGYTEADFTFSPVPVAEINELGQSIGIPGVTGNRWTTPLENVYFNGQLLQNTTQQTSLEDDNGIFFALVDSGNPSLSFPSDVMAQITEAYAANPNNATVPCDSQFELILQFAGKNFTLSKTDILVPSYLAVDSLELGGSAIEECQFQAQPDDPTEDEFGPFTSITYQFGDPLLRNVAMVFDYGNVQDSTTSSPRMGFAQR